MIIPALLGLTGDSAQFGKGELDAITMALDQQNAAGGIDGRQLADQARSLHPAMRIVLMCGYTDEAEVGSDLPVLAKPFVRQDLARALLRANKGTT